MPSGNEFRMEDANCDHSSTEVEDVDASTDSIEEQGDNSEQVDIQEPESSSFSTNYSQFFQSNQTYKSRDEAIKWVRNVGREHKMMITIHRVTKSTVGQLGKTWLCCERHGKYTPTRVHRERLPSKRCGCPFQIKCREVATGAWRLNVICGVHNHSLENHKAGHSFEGRLTSEQYELMKNLTASQYKPKQILEQLKKVDPKNETNLRQIYNARQKARKEGSEEDMQQLKAQIAERKQHEKSVLKDFSARFPHLSDDSRTRVVNLMSEILHPENVVMKEPPSSTKSTAVRQFNAPEIPMFMRGFVHRYVHVVGDGHRGFRAIAESRGLGQNEWKTVRHDLLNELLRSPDIYAPITDNKDVKWLIHALAYYEDDAPEARWFALPDMGHVVATCYQCVFAVLGSETFLPLRACPDTNIQEIGSVSIAYLPTEGHFISIELAPHSPLPPLTKLWASNHNNNVDGLDLRFARNFDAYQIGLDSM